MEYVNMHVRNMRGSSGREVPNQFIISERINSGMVETFQSYKSAIARRWPSGKVVLDKDYWDYSVTTSKYRNIFLGETTKQTEAKIKSGEYELVNLN